MFVVYGVEVTKTVMDSVKEAVEGYIGGLEDCDNYKLDKVIMNNDDFGFVIKVTNSAAKLFSKKFEDIGNDFKNLLVEQLMIDVIDKDGDVYEFFSESCDFTLNIYVEHDIPGNYITTITAMLKSMEYHNRKSI